MPDQSLKETQRLNALREYRILDTLSEEEFDRLTRLASLICDVPISLVSLIDENRQWFKSEQGLGVPETPRDIAFCNHAIRDTNLFEVEDATKDERFSTNPLVTSDPNIRFYAGYPLIDPNGHALGTLCVIDRVPRKLDERQKESLKLLAGEVMTLIVERRQKEEFEQFEKLFRITNDLIVVMGADGKMKKVNPAVNKLFGWDSDFLAKASFNELIHPDDIKDVQTAREALEQGSSTVTTVHRMLISDGSYRVVQWVATPEPATGNLFAIGRDITSEYKKDALLSASENKLRSFFENSQGLMCTHDLDGNFITVNSAGASMLGYTAGEVSRMSLFDLVPSEFHTALKRYLGKIRRDGRAGGLMTVVHKNGERRIWMFNNIVEKSTAEPYVIGNAIDITERHTLESDLRLTKEMLEQTNRVARVGGWNVNYETGEVYWSDMTKEIYELPMDFQPVINSAIAFYKEGESRDRIVALVDAAKKRGESWDDEFKIITANGHERWVRTIGHSEFVNGRSKRIYGTFQDITDAIIQREELKKAKLVAEQASLAKSEFLANMSHEIRTPLNGVIGFTDLVLKTNLTETQSQYLTIVNQSANALLSIINDILDFSKIEAGKLELDIDKCDLYEMGSQAADIITYQVQQKGLEMLLNISPELPRFAWADSVRLKQVLVNLMGNAVKFTEKGEIELKMFPLTSTDQEMVKMRFEVRDTGIGIKPEKQGLIFEAFSQEDASTTKKYGGTGLGLTISNKLLGLMGSKLQLESEPGKGSTFFFEITLKAEKGEQLKWDFADSIKNVLIVDDNDNNRYIVKQMLLLKNISSVEARNGFDALQLFARGERFDVVMMDYHMPFMDGLETIRKIREILSEQSRQQPIMLLHSSSDDEKILKACSELDVAIRMIKPIKINDLFASLSKLLKGVSETVREEKETRVNQALVKVLIAEDNAVNMLLAKTILGRIAPNAVILEANNGSEAVSICKNETPDMILMDVQMPVMNGYEATENIRQLPNTRQIPIIALTAGNVKGERERCLGAGMNDFIAKPFVEESIIPLFKKWLDAEGTTPAANKQTSPGNLLNHQDHFDLDMMKQYTGNDQEVISEMLKLTKQDLELFTGEMKKHAAAGNLAALNASGHKLSGTAMSTGLNKLNVLARKLEYLETLEGQEAEDLMRETEAEIKLVLSLIDKV